jgi:hypothetical protein
MALVGLLVAVHVVLAWTMRGPGISWGEDDAEYITLGKELLHGSYAERWDIDAPAHARLPPGFPALLAMANFVFGDRVTVYTVLVLVCSALSIGLFFYVVRRHFGNAVAVFVTGLTAINATAIADAGYIMSEAPFRLWVTLTLWSASRENPRPSQLVVAGLSVVLAALTRSIGVAIIAALALHWMLERRWKAVAFLALASVPVGLWFLWTTVAPDPNQRALYLHTIVSGVDEPQRPAVTSLFERAGSGLLLYARSHIPWALSFFGLKGNPIDNIVWAALVIGTVPVGLRVSWQRWRLLVLVLVFYLASLAFWPWLNERFVSPAIPMLLVIIAAGVWFLFRHRTERAQRLALALVASMFVVGSFQIALPVLRSMLACDRSSPVESPSCFTEDRRGFLELAAYVREQTPQQALFFVPKEAAFYLHTGRLTVRDQPFHELPVDSLGPALRRRGVTYAVVTPIGIDGPRRNKLIAKACREFEQVRLFRGGAVLLRVRENGPIDHDDETCLSIAEWKEGVPARWIR